MAISSSMRLCLPYSPTEDSNIPVHFVDFFSYDLSNREIYIYEQFTEPHNAFLAVVDSDTEPKNYREAITDPLWREVTTAKITHSKIIWTWTLATL